MTAPALQVKSLTTTNDEAPFARLWRGFMSARAALALGLVALTAALYGMGTHPAPWCVAVLMAYAFSTLYTRASLPALHKRQDLESRWPQTVGVDVMAFAALQMGQLAGLNFTPLFALPVLMAGVLGSVTIAMASAAAVVLVLLAESWVFSTVLGGDMGARTLQAGVSGMVFFGIALLSNQLAARLAREEESARTSQLAARTQTLVNQVVIDALSDGVMVVNNNGLVLSLNPAAQRMLSGSAPAQAPPFLLAANLAWRDLASIAKDRLDGVQVPANQTVVVQPRAGAPTRASVRAQIIAATSRAEESLCLVFLEDLREVEARVRTDKLAAMGRMSAAVAHEIRNPLAAISQANALLCEELTEPTQQRLSKIVADNAKRLARIVNDVLDISRSPHAAGMGAVIDNVGELVRVACADWADQSHMGHKLTVRVNTEAGVLFEADQLRQVLINLLDNASRYAGDGALAIQVETSHTDQQVCTTVWSNGDALTPDIETHLFEPFFSSESRSTGLGLYICRELCERHGAQIGYQRSNRGTTAGNEFAVVLRATPAHG